MSHDPRCKKHNQIGYGTCPGCYVETMESKIAALEQRLAEWDSEEWIKADLYFAQSRTIAALREALAEALQCLFCAKHDLYTAGVTHYLNRIVAAQHQGEAALAAVPAEKGKPPAAPCPCGDPDCDPSIYDEHEQPAPGGEPDLPEVEIPHEAWFDPSAAPAGEPDEHFGTLGKALVEATREKGKPPAAPCREWCDRCKIDHYPGEHPVEAAPAPCEVCGGADKVWITGERYGPCPACREEAPNGPT